MAQSLRQVRSRVKSVENIKKITRAMEMVSAARLKPLEKNLSNSKEYFLKIEGILNDALGSFRSAKNSLLQEKSNNKDKKLLCLVTSDTGLCGSYNNNIIRLAEDFIYKNSSSSVSLVIVGKKGLSFFKKRDLTIVGSYTEIYGHYSKAIADKIARHLIEMFLSGKADEVYVAYTSFISASRYKLRIDKLLNVEGAKANDVEYLVEPDINKILNDLLPLYITSKVRTLLADAFTCEYSARVIAMSEATDNARELLDALVLLRNKMRQAHITGEIIEIISSADALKG
ncbi:MAG: ATP synthase F1 subunit gamma [Candidatus Omnitrophica bacterium]|nr:ATP synthase F1 subunit gamma [Candidatus Omnitrophota bacterium]